MAHFNGWQRAWIVLTVIWGVIVSSFAYMLVPTHISHVDLKPNPEVIAHMTTKSWKGDDCHVQFEIELPDGQRYSIDLDGGRTPSEKDIAASKDLLDQGAKAVRQITRVDVPLVGSSETASLCFSNDVPEAERDRIAAEYSTAYGKTLNAQRWRFGALAIGYWLMPGVVLYALGWSVGWIRRGFRGPTAS